MRVNQSATVCIEHPDSRTVEFRQIFGCIEASERQCPVKFFGTCLTCRDEVASDRGGTLVLLA